MAKCWKCSYLSEYRNDGLLPRSCTVVLNTRRRGSTSKVVGSHISEVKPEPLDDETERLSINQKLKLLTTHFLC